MTELSGRCLCGAVTWRTDSNVRWAGHCHCESCRRATASPMTSFFGVARDSLEWSGQLGDVSTSQGKVVRYFCTRCGTQMAYQNAIWPDETHLYAATMNDPTAFVPQAHYHYGERLAWLTITDQLPKYTGSAEG